MPPLDDAAHLDQARTLQARLRELDAQIEADSARLETLQDENRELWARLARLESWRGSETVKGCQVALVTGQAEEGEPVPLDSGGRVEVSVNWDGREQTLKARLSTPWLIPGGGVSFTPRKGQAVYLAFLDGLPQDPIVIGHCPNSSNPLPYDTSSSGQSATLAATLDKDGAGRNPATGNQYKNLIRSQSPMGSGKASELAMVDQPGSEGISLASTGNLREHAGGDHYRHVQGERISSHGGDLYQNHLSNLNKKVGKDSSHQVNGDHQTQVNGSKQETVQGDYHLEVPGQYSMKVAHGKSVYFIWDSEANNVFLGGRDTFVAGEEVDVRLAICLELSHFIMDFYLQRMVNTIYFSEVVGEGTSNLGTKFKNSLTALKNASAEILDTGAEMEDDLLPLEDAETAVRDFGAKLCNGMKIHA